MTSRRLAWLSAASLLTAVLIAVLGAVLVPPYTRDSLCVGSYSDDADMSCSTSTSGSELLNNLVLGASGLALLLCVVALLAAVVLAVRADVRARRSWQQSEAKGLRPASAAPALLMGAVGAMLLGLVGALAASWLADGMFTFPVLRPPEFGDLTRLGLESIRVGVALAIGVGALVLQWLGILLLLGAGVDAAAVASVSRRRAEVSSGHVR